MKRHFLLFTSLAPSSAFACAACYGQDGGPLASGMNWGIVSLLGMVVLVLGGVAGFFIYLAKRSAAVTAKQAAPLSPSAGPILEAASAEAR